MSFLFVKIDAHEPIVHIQFQQFGKLLHDHIHILFQLLEGALVIGGAEVQFDQGAQQVIVHQPEIGEVVTLRLLPLKSVFEKIVQQLIPFFVAACELVQIGFSQFHDLLGNALLRFLWLGVLLLFEFHRQTLLDAKRGLTVDLFKLRPLRDPLATIEE